MKKKKPYRLKIEVERFTVEGSELCPMSEEEIKLYGNDARKNAPSIIGIHPLAKKLMKKMRNIDLASKKRTDKELKKLFKK